MKNKLQQSALTSPSQNKQNSPILNSRIYYYTNCMFNGLTKTMKRVGTGIILFEDGMCGIVSYNNNEEFHGLSIFYRSRCLISVEYIRNRIVSIMYRIDGFLLYLKYNQHSKIHGDCYIVNFIERSIYQVNYNEGYLKSKVKMLTIQKISVDSLFINDAYHLIVGQLHNKALRHEITSQNISNIKMKKIGNKVLVNYMQNTQDKLAQGLGFQFIYRAPENGGYDPETNRFMDEFELNIIEKGMYKDNMLDGYGQKVFKNNNLYQGFFSNNVFNGEGCLKNTHKGSWVYGIFSNGEMKQIIDFSNESNDHVRSKMLLENLKQSQPNFISQMIEQNNFDFLDTELQKISAQGNLEEFHNETFEQRKQQIMKKIAQQFTQIQYTNPISIDEEANTYKLNRTVLGKTKKQQQQFQESTINKTKKKPYHIINSLVPESVSNIKFIRPQPQTFNNDSYIQQSRFYQKEKQIVEKPTKIVTKVERPTDKKVGKIFHKSYSHLEEEDENRKKLQAQNNIENQNKSRIRKSHIFTDRVNQMVSKSDLSPGGQSPSTQRLRLNSTTPYKRRSAQRKTKIFNSTLKLKKISPGDPKGGQNEEDLGMTKLQSIRKGSIQKRSLLKSKNKKTTTIFDQQDEKSAEVVGKFVYRYQTVGSNSNQQKNQLKKTNKSPKNLVKSSKIMN